MLFVPKDTSNLGNDPHMINPKGIRVQVPENRVAELLKRGFILENKDWQPSQPEPQTPQIYKAIYEAKEKAAKNENLLAITEV